MRPLLCLLQDVLRDCRSSTYAEYRIVNATKLISLPIDNALECSQACESNAFCRGWDFDMGNTLCSLFANGQKTAAIQRDTSDRICGLCIPPDAAWKVHLSKLCVRTNFPTPLEQPYVVYDKQHVTDKDRCEAQSEFESRCTSWIWSNGCNLYDV